MTTIPKLKINGFNDVLSMLKIDEWNTPSLIDGTKLKVSVHQAKNGIKYFVLHTPFQVYGWTTDIYTLDQVTTNMCIYDCNELYELLRGRKVD